MGSDWTEPPPAQEGVCPAATGCASRGRPGAGTPRIPSRCRRGTTYDALILTVEEAASRVGRSPETVRRWIRSGRLSATIEGRRRVIDPSDLDSIRDEIYPMLDLPPEWQQLEDGTPAPNWVAVIALARNGR